MNVMIANKTYVLLPAALVALALAACGSKTPETSEDPAVQAQIEEDAELKAKEEELARREAELALKEKEQELARREAELAKATTKPAAKPAAKTPAPAPAPAPKVAAGPKQYTVPAGTSLSVELPAAISTKTARVGDRVSAYLTSDLVVDGKVVAKAGALLQGSVSSVVSGSQKIGGTPELGLSFDNLTLADGSDTSVNGTVTQVAAKSDTARDTAKIAGGAIAGAVIGHQVDGDKGKIIGGLLGAAAGAAAAKKTGTEVDLPAGTVLGFTLNSPVTVTM
ncbi:MAG TPA: glycine zipper 2TM domain-containing protein [Steroidobacteraceae bacterium]|nr:glycine zipper 2TM domain-containing protein [Steroidobacteraceae bacterium]